MAVDSGIRIALYAAMRHAVFRVCALLALALSALTVPSVAAPAASGPALDPRNVIADDIQSEALGAYRRHAAARAFKGSDIVIVDYRQPSNAPRLFILNVATGAVEAYYVAHGRGSDPGHTQRAMRLGDAPTTGMSSVGAFRGLERYQSPENGPALRLAGLDWTNANAYDRLIVFHTAGYFNPAAGRFGRSCGCFVVTKEAMERVYGVLADGGFLYAGPARLHDKTASAVRDCNPHCGGRCSEPLIASAKPPRQPKVPKAPPPTAVAAAEPAMPTPKPAALPPPVRMAKAGPPPPVPLFKPDLAPIPAVELAAMPVPAAKPDLESVLAAVPLADPPPVPLEKPQFRPAIDGITAEQVRIVPDPMPGEVPVPVQKPSPLKQMAELLP